MPTTKQPSDDGNRALQKIDHWAHFPDQPSRRAFIKRALALGFTIADEFISNTTPRPYWVVFFRRETNGFAHFANIKSTLTSLAEELGGNYDGWEMQLGNDASSIK
jgi:hypothetical protein